MQRKNNRRNGNNRRFCVFSHIKWTSNNVHGNEEKCFIGIIIGIAMWVSFALPCIRIHYANCREPLYFVISNSASNNVYLLLLTLICVVDMCWFKFQNERCNWVIKTHTSQSVHSGFESRSRDWLCWVRIFVTFPNYLHANAGTVTWTKLRQLLSVPFQSIMYSHFTLRFYATHAAQNNK